MMPSASGIAFKRAEHLVGVEVEDHEAAFAATVGDEAPAGGGHNRDAVVTLLARDVPEGLAGVFVDHHGVGAAGDEEAMAAGVDGEVIPGTLATYVPLLDILPLRLSRGGERPSHGQCREGGCGHDHTDEVRGHEKSLLVRR